ncbi:uncharacterized protein LOC128547142 [Mercenaria mercenaria]|uniref:uncharacterized protein LOC128547142 n=1 Tax=Mercenaria mercenaria TaxID=6596 RepID=UPI00234E42BA|nr:uncharacterized protein LOC128547142 [Mercenaria mercenaria]
MATEEQKSFKVTFNDRKVLIRFLSAEQFIKKCREKFKIQNATGVIFLDSDGTEVDEDCLSIYSDKTEFKLIVHEENMIIADSETEVATIDAGTANKHCTNLVQDLMDTISIKDENLNAADSETEIETIDAGKAEINQEDSVPARTENAELTDVGSDEAEEDSVPARTENAGLTDLGSNEASKY